MEAFEDRIHVGPGRADHRSEGDGVPVGAHQDASPGQCFTDSGEGHLLSPFVLAESDYMLANRLGHTPEPREPFLGRDRLVPAQPPPG